MAERSKRERKTVELFSPAEPPKEVKKTAIPEGGGIKLGSIPNVAFKLDALKAGDDLLDGLHQILYKTKGKSSVRKRDVKSFSGFGFSDEEKEEEVKKVEARLGKWTLVQVNALLDTLDIPRGSGAEATKESKVRRVVEFLTKPEVLSDKDLAAEAAKKKEKVAKAKEKTAAKKTPNKKTPVRKASAKKAPAKAESEDEVVKDDEEAEEEETAEEAGTGKKAAAKKGSKEAGAGKKTSAKQEAKTEGTGKKATKATGKADPKPPATGKKTGTKRKASEVEDKPAKKAKKTEQDAASKWPAAKQIETDVIAILKEALDGNKDITPADVYAKLGELYGLSVAEIKKKKASIKSISNKFMAGNKADEEDKVEEEQAEEPAKENTQAAEDEEEEEPLITEQANTEGDEFKPDEEPEEEAKEMEVDEPVEDAPAVDDVAEAEPVKDAVEEPAAEENLANGDVPKLADAEKPNAASETADEQRGAVEPKPATAVDPETAAKPSAVEPEEPALPSASLEDVDQYINSL